MQFVYLMLLAVTHVFSTTETNAIRKKKSIGEAQIVLSPSFHFQFPPDSKNSSVFLAPTLRYPLDAFSLCYRIRPSATNDTSSNCILSYAVPNQDNEITSEIKPTGEAQLSLKGNTNILPNSTILTGQWNHICIMWSSEKKYAGAITLTSHSEWKDVLLQGPTIQAGGQFVLGQDQDSVGGGFSPDQVFNGELTDLHMWDYWLPATTITKYLHCNKDVEGNILSWNNLQMTTNNVEVLYLPSDTHSYC